MALNGLAVRLKMVRDHHKHSQEAFARRVDCPSPLVCEWERGRKKPSYLSLKKIGKAYDVDLNWLILGPTVVGEEDTD